MTFEIDYFSIALIIVLITFCVILILGIQDTLGLELTPEQIQDERKTQICIIYNISNEECWMVYGGINNDWEPEK